MKLNSLLYTIKLLSPVLISNLAENNSTRTLGHIPGSTVLGIFASQYIKLKNVKDAHLDGTFYDWFLNGEIIFSGAFPLIQDGAAELIAFPAPLCLEQSRKDSRVYNLLYEEVDEKLKSLGGFVVLQDAKLYPVEPRKIFRFHHARKDFRYEGTSPEGNIFTYEALDAGQEFRGTIYGEPAQLATFLELFGDKIHTRIGKSKKTEYGDILIELKSSDEKSENDMNFHECSFTEDNEAILTFSSPCILFNEFGEAAVSSAQLEKSLSTYFAEEVKIESLYISTVFIENYLSVWRMKKPGGYALSPGSTLKIVFSHDLTAENKAKLKKLTIEGFGERRNEGFGRIMLNWPIQKRYTKKTPVEKEYDIPEVPLPPEAKKIFDTIITSEVEKAVIAAALTEVHRFAASKNNPTNSLLGKLMLMLNNSDWGEFCKSLEGFKKPAQSQLERCHNDEVTLWDFLKKFDGSEIKESFKKLSKQTGKLAKISGYNLDDTERIKDLTTLYWNTFFREMRRLNKLKGVGENA